MLCDFAIHPTQKLETRLRNDYSHLAVGIDESVGVTYRSMGDSKAAQSPKRSMQEAAALRSPHVLQSAFLEEQPPLPPLAAVIACDWSREHGVHNFFAPPSSFLLI